MCEELLRQSLQECREECNKLRSIVLRLQNENRRLEQSLRNAPQIFPFEFDPLGEDV